jgi:hypothetical protein
MFTTLPLVQSKSSCPVRSPSTGQRFVPDGWALAQVTFDRIKWNEEIPGFTWFGKVIRRYPSALDVAYSVLVTARSAGKSASACSTRPAGTIFGTACPTQHNLTAVAATIERLSPAAWEDSIYVRWLAALRTLSAPTTDAHFPQAMRTRAWAMRTLNTQLASYTELKHDNRPFMPNSLTPRLSRANIPLGLSSLSRNSGER